MRAPVRQIIFGVAAERDKQYLDMLKYIQEYNKTHDLKIDVTKCKLESNRYRLIPDKQFDICSELRSNST